MFRHVVDVSPGGRDASKFVHAIGFMPNYTDIALTMSDDDVSHWTLFACDNHPGDVAGDRAIVLVHYDVMHNLILTYYLPPGPRKNFILVATEGSTIT